MASTLPRKSPPRAPTATAPTTLDLLRSFLSCAPRWNDTDRALAARILEKAPPDPLAAFRADPATIFRRAGLTPDPWQAHLLQAVHPQTLLLCSRQAGKSQTAAALALKTALLNHNATVLIVSPTLRQSGECFRKVKNLYNACFRMRQVRPAPHRFVSVREAWLQEEEDAKQARLAQPVQESALQMELANGSRIISLPGRTADTIVGYSAITLLIIDEASRVSDTLYYAIRPVLAVSQGQLLALSTPWGKRGWFWKAWTKDEDDWHRVRVTADECPRIPKDFLAREKREIGERWYRQEYLTEFVDVIDAVFRSEDIDRAVRLAVEEGVTPLFPNGRPHARAH